MGPQDHTGDRLMTTEELANYMSVPLQTIYAWRAHRKAPPAIRVGKFLRFRRSDVDAWLTARSDVVA